jgi:predicted neuraminidase
MSDATDDGGSPPEALSPPERHPARQAGFAAGVVPQRHDGWVSPLPHAPSVHGSTMCALPDGELLAVWYGGTREGAADVAIFSARLPVGAREWSKPERIVDRVLAQSELDRAIKKVGNAVVFPDRHGVVWLVYVSVSVGGWSGSALNVKTSRDQGRTWSESRRLTLNPFLNLSTLVRNKPILAADGRIGLPVYHELAFKFPQILWLTPGPAGEIVDYRIRNLPGKVGLIQPALVALGGDRVLMLLRDRSAERRVRASFSSDNGWTWSQAAATSLPNPDAAVDALRLRDGRILLVYNHAASGRENLRLAVSDDDGRTWRPGPWIESGVGKEYSYPCLTEGADGGVHLTYTWERQRIRHVALNLAWLDREVLARGRVD